MKNVLTREAYMDFAGERRFIEQPGQIAADWLTSLGFTNVRHFHGGMAAGTDAMGRRVFVVPSERDFMYHLPESKKELAKEAVEFFKGRIARGQDRFLYEDSSNCAVAQFAWETRRVSFSEYLTFHNEAHFGTTLNHIAYHSQGSFAKLILFLEA